MSMNNLKDIHNSALIRNDVKLLFYQDVNEQFEGYTQRGLNISRMFKCCFIRMSMNNLKDIHNQVLGENEQASVVLSGCQ